MNKIRSAARRGQIKADLILFIVALIWGSAFVAQRLGMTHVGPFTFNAARFTLGGLVLLPAIGWRRLRGLSRKELAGGALLGLLIFCGASCQQIGLIYTTASKAGFITGLYVVIVPLLLALIWRERASWSSWAGAVIAVVGLALLSVEKDLRLSIGDTWVFIGAFAWAFQVIATGRIAPHRDPLRLAVVAYGVCALLCTGLALTLEWGTWGGTLLAGPAILYAGVLSTGLAYTGQIVAQRHAHPAHAAIIMSTEAVFATFFGWLMLHEVLTDRQIIGCALVLLSMLLAQVPSLVPTAWRVRRSQARE